MTEVDVGALGQAVLVEIFRRLKEDPQNISPTLMGQIARGEIERRQPEREKPVEEEPPSLVEIIADVGLPVARKRQLVRAEINRLRTEMGKLDNLLKVLEEE